MPRGSEPSVQAKGYAKAFLSGQPRRATIATTLFRDKLSELKAT